jgi:hypothetical protein
MGMLLVGDSNSMKELYDKGVEMKDVKKEVGKGKWGKRLIIALFVLVSFSSAAQEWTNYDSLGIGVVNAWDGVGNTTSSLTGIGLGYYGYSFEEENMVGVYAGAQLAFPFLAQSTVAGIDYTLNFSNIRHFVNINSLIGVGFRSSTDLEQYLWASIGLNFDSLFYSEEGYSSAYATTIRLDRTMYYLGLGGDLSTLLELGRNTLLRIGTHYSFNFWGFGIISLNGSTQVGSVDGYRALWLRPYVALAWESVFSW